MTKNATRKSFGKYQNMHVLLIEARKCCLKNVYKLNIGIKEYLILDRVLCGIF